MEIEKLKKEELIERAKTHGFFNKKGTSEIWARTNGHFYYKKPPAFIDGHDAYKIKRSDVQEQSIEYPMNGKETSKVILDCETQEELDALYTEGKLLDAEERKGVLKALEEKKDEFSPKGE